MKELLYELEEAGFNVAAPEADAILTQAFQCGDDIESIVAAALELQDKLIRRKQWKAH